MISIKIQMVLDVCLCKTSLTCMWVNALIPGEKVAEPEGLEDLVGGWVRWSGASQTKPLLAPHSFPRLVLHWGISGTEDQSLVAKKMDWVPASVWRFKKKTRKLLSKKPKSLSRACDFPFHLFHEHSTPCKRIHSSTMVIQGDKVDIVSHTAVLYTEILGTIKIEVLPSAFPRHKNKNERLKSCAF